MSSALALVEPVEHENLLEVAGSFRVTNQEENQQAAEFLRGLKDLDKAIRAAHDPVVEAADKAHTEAVRAKKAALEPVVAAIGNLKVQMSDYQARVERERRAEIERKRREAEAEAERKRTEEMERRAKEAEALRKLQAVEEAEAVEQAPLPEPEPVAPVYVPEPPKPNGITYRKVKKYKVTNLKALCGAIGLGTAPEHLVKPDPARIGDYLRSHGWEEIPGVYVFEETQTVVRS